MTPEGRVKEQVKKLLKKYKAYYHMPVQNGMGAPSLDFICCHRGKYLAIETKAPGKELTPRQSFTVREINQAGGITLVISDQEGLDVLEFWLMGDEDGRTGHLRSDESPVSEGSGTS